MPSTHIDHVIRRLEYVIQWSIKNKSRIGYFASLYERVTIEVDKMIDKKTYFRNNNLMMQFDVIFAEYYLLSFEGYMRGEKIPEVWKLAFDRTDDIRLSVLQHLLLGMNAHINLDLAVTVANLSTPETLHELKPDFYKINELLSKLVDLIQEQIAEIYKPLIILDRLMGRVDEFMLSKIMAKFRDRAWKIAEQLVQLSGNERTQKIHEIDRMTAKFARNTIAKPLGVRFKPLAYFIRNREKANVGKIIQSLHHAQSYRKWSSVF